MIGIEADNKDEFGNDYYCDSKLNCAINAWVDGVSDRVVRLQPVQLKTLRLDRMI